MFLFYAFLARNLMPLLVVIIWFIIVLVVVFNFSSIIRILFWEFFR
jgi:succinate dehydrogenase/fumarate reductase cytochrome b subunit